MSHRLPGNHGVWVKRVRIVSKGGDGDAVLRAEGVYVVRLGAGEAGHVDVRNPGKLAFGFADAPAHDLDALELLGSSEFEDLVQSELREDGSYKSQLHKVMS